MDYCTQDCVNLIGDFDTEKTCQFTRDNCDQEAIDFIITYFCVFKNSFLVILIFGLIIVVAVFETLSHLTNDYLAPCVEKLVVSFRFSETLAGMTFLAFANGAPDVLTAIIAGNSDSSDTALIPFGSIFGALLFSTTIILSRVIFHSKLGEKTGLYAKEEAVKPMILYIGSTLLLLLISFIFKEMRWYFAIIIVLIYFVYVIYELIIHQDEKKNVYDVNQTFTSQDSQSNIIGLVQNKGLPQAVFEEEPTGYEKFTGLFNKGLDFILVWMMPPCDPEGWVAWRVPFQMTISTFLVFFQQGYLFVQLPNGFPAVVVAEGVTVGIYILISIIYRCKFPTPSWIFEAYRFIVQISIISYLCQVLVDFMELFRVVTGINSVYIGLTLFAFGSSIGDYFSIVTFAKRGKGRTAIAGVFSGQLFNLLIGLGTSMLIRTLNKGAFDFDLFPSKFFSSDGISNLIIWLVIVFSLINLIVTLCYLIKSHYFMGEGYSNYLLGYYFVALIGLSAMTIGADIAGGVKCDYPENL